MHHSKRGVYYPKGGTSEITYRIIQFVEKHGGKVLMKAPVSSILLDEKENAYGALNPTNIKEDYTNPVLCSIWIILKILVFFLTRSDRKDRRRSWNQGSSDCFKCWNVQHLQETSASRGSGSSWLVTGSYCILHIIIQIVINHLIYISSQAFRIMYILWNQAKHISRCLQVLMALRKIWVSHPPTCDSLRQTTWMKCMWKVKAVKELIFTVIVRRMTIRSCFILFRLDEYFDLDKEDAPDNIPMMYMSFPSARDPTSHTRFPGEPFPPYILV